MYKSINCLRCGTLVRMNRKSKILLWIFILLIVLSVSATFYKTVILQDFVVSGIGVEISENTTYVYFVYEGVEYEMELAANNFDDIERAISTELMLPLNEINKDFLDSLHETYLEAKKFNYLKL